MLRILIQLFDLEAYVEQHGREFKLHILDPDTKPCNGSLKISLGRIKFFTFLMNYFKFL